MFKGRMVTSAEAKAYKNTAAWIAKASGCKLLTGDVCVTISYKPKLTKKGLASKTRQDLDNVIKVAFDALNGIAWHDDNQVVKLIALIDKPCENGGLTVIIESNV